VIVRKRGSSADFRDFRNENKTPFLGNAIDLVHRNRQMSVSVKRAQALHWRFRFIPESEGT
jgi:hypothetical protein